MSYIEHLIEPDRLLLSWQAQDSKDRSRYVVAELLDEQGAVTLNYLVESDDYQAAKEHGFCGYPAFQINQASSFNTQVLDALIRRLPPRSRSDFYRYLELRGINPDSEISDFTLLGYTGAKLPDDGFEVVHPFNEVNVAFEIIIEVAGFRYESELQPDEIALNSKVDFILEPENCSDANAIRIELAGNKLGYVDRGRLELFHRCLSEGYDIGGEVSRKNGTAERPLVYIFTRFSPSK